MQILGAIFLGLLVNYLTGGLPFSALLCIFAGIFLVMPGLLTFSLQDLKLLYLYPKPTLGNVIFNVLFIPVLFFFLGFLFSPKDLSLWYSLLMLAILPGGGLLMSWIQKSHADKKYGFSLFVLNMTLFIPLFFLTHYLITNNLIGEILHFHTFQTCEVERATQGLISCGKATYMKPLLAYLFLIILPFILSRIVRLFPNIQHYVSKHIANISAIASFLIVAYIFSLKIINSIFSHHMYEILKILGILAVCYGIVFFVSFLMTKKLSIEASYQKAVFWNVTIRFITLGLVLSILYIPYVGSIYIIVFASAYLVQLVYATVFLGLQKKKPSPTHSTY